MELSRRDPGASITRLWIGGRWIEARRLAIDFYEAAYVLDVRVAEVKRMVRHGELRSGSVDDSRTLDVESLVTVVEALVRDRELDETSLVLLRELVAGQRRIPATIVRSRPRRMLRNAT
jgi:hypothetical protein